jgi:RraA family protein
MAIILARDGVDEGAAMTYDKDARVDHYIDALPDWQQEICQQIRDLVHDADPEVVETIKRRVQPYFVLEGNICALLAAKDHVNVFLYDGAIVPDPEGIITGGQNNQTARTVAIRENETINARALREMFRQIIANNRAGGWRTIKRKDDHGKADSPVSAAEIPPQVWQLDAASLSDANKALRILPRELRPYRRGLRMVGRAVTVVATADLVPVLAGLEQCGAGDILVVDAGTTEHAVLGELFGTEAVRRGMAGIVVYGLCRDTATLAKLPLPIYSLGTVPRAVGATRLPVTQQPVRLGDVEVRPGEILVGDDDGILVLNDGELAAALDGAEAIQQREAVIRAAILDGTSLFEQLNFAEHVANLQSERATSLAFRVQ